MPDARQKPTPKRRARRKSAGEWKPAFIAAMRKDPCVRDACRAAKINRATAYEHRDSDPDFKKQWDEAKAEGIDVLEKIARKRARGRSDVLLIFLLKSYRPETFRETTRHLHGGDPDSPPVTHKDMTEAEAAELYRAHLKNPA